MKSMSVKARLLPDARKLYIEGCFNCEEIGRKLNTSAQNIHNWKRGERIGGYDWDEERALFLKRKSGLLDETKAFLHEFIVKTRKDIEDGKEISQSRIYILKDFIPFLSKLQDGDRFSMPDEFEFSGSLADMIKSQASLCVQQLYQEDLKGSDRLKLLKQLAAIQKDIQQTELERHMYHLDAKTVSLIIRRFQPDATDDEIIKIFAEESANAKKTNTDTKK
ncbi:MAG: DUF1804 family protein [Candidatus Marinimicrobia bacterium]|nr:DUF1804 family protein [Candidatus Neomarinimicrobiota bacterium]